MDNGSVKMKPVFIKASDTFDKNYIGDVSAPLFRKTFYIDDTKNAILKVCGLGYGYYYINGKEVSADLFTAPVSRYDKLCWYNVYDVSALLQKGKNVIAVILGCGFFNENFDSHWGNNKANWRDNPKFALSLEINGKNVLKSDDSWKCAEKSFVINNQLRSGETFDARLYDENWKNVDFDDSKWHKTVVDDTFKPLLKECKCEPVRECEEYDFVSCYKTEKGYVLDFGVNISGYVRIFFEEKEGTEIKISHAEEINEDYSLKLNGLNRLYPSVDFQTDRYICGKKPYHWSPKFTYHGFRYALVEGLTKIPQKDEIKAIFVHNDVKKISDFYCSDELLNKIYNAGIRATYSNMCYALTDCPTREKFGWTNDAQASAEQTLINFDIKSFYEKWIEDFKSCMTECGALPAIVPTHGYGYNHGPVADGAFFEIPYRIFQYTGDKSCLISCLSYFKKYYDFFISKKNNTEYWLCDWDGFTNHNIDKEFIKYFYTVKFCRIINLAINLSGEEPNVFYDKEINYAEEQLKKFIGKDGSCVLDGQTAPAALICLGIGDKTKLIKQLKSSIDNENGHLNVGMFGIQYIYDALSDNGEEEYAYKVVTAIGEPSIAEWIRKGATTLWETWKDSGFTDSRNHQMYSNVLAWLFKHLVGIKTNDGYKHVTVSPTFVKELDFCKGSIETDFGSISINWQRYNKKIIITIDIPQGVEAIYKGNAVNCGKNIFEEKYE